MSQNPEIVPRGTIDVPRPKNRVQDFSHPSCKILVTGGSGTGKTQLLGKMIKEAPVNFRFVFDHDGQFAHRFRVQALYSEAELREKVAKGGWVVWDPIELFPGDREEAFRFFCTLVYNLCQETKGRKIAYFDELQDFVTVNERPKEFLMLCETGRRYGIDLFLAAQATNRLHNAVRNQVTELFVFQQIDSKALEFETDTCGLDPEEIKALPKYEYIHKILRGENAGTVQRGGGSE